MASLKNDMQECTDREIPPKIFATEVLVNSPMNEPAYREAHELRTRPVTKGWIPDDADEATPSRRRLLVSSATFTEADHRRMVRLRNAYLVFENYQVLRHVGRFLRQEALLREVDLHERLLDVADREPGRFPAITLTVRSMKSMMAPPVSWRRFVDELHRFAVEDLGVADGSDLRTVLAVQHAVLPAPGRSFPWTVELDHDYAAWHQAMQAAKDDGHHADWPLVVPPLRTFGPARFTVEDLWGVCDRSLGFDLDDTPTGDWELDSPVSRFVTHKAAL